MNHFELYHIPVSLRPDPALVKTRFYELSRQFHPDFHGQASEEEQDAMLEKASQVNMAYKIFRNPDATIKYVLQLKGLLEEEEKYQLPPDFLMEMLELNDQALEADTPEAKQQLAATIDNIKQALYEPVEKTVADYQEGITSEKELLQVKEYYYRKKYLDRVLEGNLKI
ncbi:iron-sulfur cluster co-chaperone HscB C-terminal domain-containing protein [Sediminibacterium soli]|uniref:iron-sulfur cluster co-chaperone HscB C-terminal domain-containing protein n=1 Tax=Sediminibacterium soli TaxID=2698829 RepID=UPI00137A056D|nr:iron-sulfur cluster co-chaperone HscB C-terminal domain-containing protein [Sediminibacterium soli]NCI46151.1 Fe-S protein assembly co-chaperone HscB [Sediminibacterium soli]